MRPINKGEPPATRTAVTRSYSDFKIDLINRLGTYCSYCERSLGASLAVEHVQPKSIHKDLEVEWSNFLLACGNCNSIKSKKDMHLESCYWPDRDNTMIPFQYGEGGIVQITSSLNENQRDIASSTLNLTGLNRQPELTQATDLRWSERRTAWGKATRAKRHLQSQNTIEMREQIVDTATSTGFFSVWMTVFQDESNMKRRFIHAFPGTSVECFGESYEYLARSGGLV